MANLDALASIAHLHMEKSHQGILEMTTHDHANTGIDRKFRRSERSPFKICAVCGDKAMGHNFDAITCESCKAFFRRNALKDQDYHRCSFGNACEITAVSRRFCQKCRLIKCFRVGMKKEWIENEDKLMLRKRKRIEKNKRKSSCPEIDHASPFWTPETVGTHRMAASTEETILSESDQSIDALPYTLKRSFSSASQMCAKRICTGNSVNGNFSIGQEIRRESVIRRASANSEASTNGICNDLSILPQNGIQNGCTSITIPRSIFMQLIDTCHWCCLKAGITVPPVVDIASTIMLTQLGPGLKY